MLSCHPTSRGDYCFHLALLLCPSLCLIVLPHEASLHGSSSSLVVPGGPFSSRISPASNRAACLGNVAYDDPLSRTPRYNENFHDVKITQDLHLDSSTTTRGFLNRAQSRCHLPLNHWHRWPPIGVLEIPPCR
uniref:Uncharacterized protein n=1 Tax=Picea glauca TaxID=3330 RepID=A0A101LTP5_PICGL|nr:hypothetical protein ABT39_MTgene3611 [Picea glauca]